MISTSDVCPQSVLCIHRQPASWCWTCTDLRAEFAVLARLAAGPATLDELADPDEPERWLGGGVASALLRLKAAGRVVLVSGGRFSVVGDEGGKGGGIELENDLTIGIDARSRHAGCSRSRRHAAAEL